MKLFALVLLSINCALVAPAVTVKATTKAPVATTKPTLPPTKLTVATVPTVPPTLPPFNKDDLIKKGQEIQKNANEMIVRLTAANRGSLTAELKRLSDTVGLSIKDLQATDEKTGPTLLKYIETELYWFEERMKIEFQVLAAAEMMLNQLLNMANALSVKITAAIKKVEDTPMGEVLKQEGDSLSALISDLVNAKNPTAIEQAGKDLAKMTDRVDKELKVINGF